MQTTPTELTLTQTGATNPQALEIGCGPVRAPLRHAKRILVTGADGFIGSHLTEELVRRGCTVRAFVFYNSLNSWGWLDRVAKEITSQLDVVLGDVRDSSFVSQAMKGCDVVLHLAALIGIPFSYASPHAYVETNVGGTLNILQAAKALDVEKVVCTSTSEVYGTARFVPITEEHPVQAQSPYAATKIAADQIALSYYSSFGTPVTVIRPFNTYGPRQSARAVIPTIVTQLAAGTGTISLGSVHPTRDFNFVADVVEGFILVAESKALVGQVVNIGSNYEISIADTAHLIAELMGVPFTMNHDPARVRPAMSEVERLWADNTKARSHAGWVPRYSGLDGLRRGLCETINWFRDPANLRLYKVNRYNV